MSRGKTRSLSTCCQPFLRACKLARWKGKSDLQDGGNQRPLQSQKVTKMYNSYVGGSNLLTAYKRNIWYYNFFFLNHILEVTTLNTYRRYKGIGKEGISLASFKEKLVDQLIAGNCFGRDTSNLSVHATQRPDIHFNCVKLTIW